MNMKFHFKAVSVLIFIQVMYVTSESKTDQPTTPVPRFKCGRDRCRINGDYCDKQDSANPDDWSCLPCLDIPDKWCKNDLTRVPRDCLGYCTGLELKVTDTEHDQLMEEAVFPQDGFNAFTIRIGHFSAIFTLLAPMCIIGLLVIVCILRRKLGRLTRGHHINDQEEGLNLVTNQDRMPQPVVRQETARETVGTQTDCTDYLGPDCKTDPTITNQERGQIILTQPDNKGPHGVRVLPKSTVNVDNNGRDDVDDQTFLDVQS